MTDTLHVRRFDVRYRVDKDDAVVRARLDALLARVLEHDLEPALVERGLPVGEEICVRDVHAPARVRLTTGASDTGRRRLRRGRSLRRSHPRSPRS